MVPVIRATVTAQGVLSFQADERQALTRWLKTLIHQPVEVTVKRAKSQRSLDQNAWVFGVAYPLLAESFGYDAHEIEDLHYALVAKWGGEHYDKRIGAMVPNKRSSKLSTREFSEYMEWLVRYGAQSGVVIPLPGESEAA